MGNFLLSYLLSFLPPFKYFWMLYLFSSDQLDIFSPSHSSAGNISYRGEPRKTRGQAVIEEWQKISTLSLLMTAMLHSLHFLSRRLGKGKAQSFFRKLAASHYLQMCAKCLMNSTGYKAVMWLWSRRICSYWTIHNPFVSGKSLRLTLQAASQPPLHTQPWGLKLIYFYLIFFQLSTAFNKLL